jgi:hypothetical protein
VIAQVPVERFAADVLHDLTKCGEPVVAVRPPRPWLDVHGQRRIARPRMDARTPRSASRTAAVAVTIFVVENHGHTMPGEAGTRAALSASPAPGGPHALRPGHQHMTSGTPSPASARVRSPAIAPAGISAAQR